MSTIDLNADLGEGLGMWRMGDDDALLGVVTSANVATGFHAGDPLIMRTTCQKAAEQGVTVGAHVAYRDLHGFGRRAMDMAPDELTADVLYQVSALEGIARAAGTEVGYCKPHGALYNTIAKDEGQARATAEALAAFRPGLAVLGLPGTPWQEAAEAAGLRFVAEAFADRAYTPEGQLVSRRQPGAVLHDPEQITQRCVAMATGHPIEDVEGNALTLTPGSICVHGDTPGAVEIAQAVRRGLQAAGTELRSFA
ncbi:LamB/YcsF family protein [Kytococcus sedentarius]|uniref:LamB/YcsF family protein n=1 Tax=Kytococcus sedentarius TaxID=1276 RepID=UPI0035BC5807